MYGSEQSKNPICHDTLCSDEKWAMLYHGIFIGHHATIKFFVRLIDLIFFS